jgi:hypothetical protein
MEDRGIPWDRWTMGGGSSNLGGSYGTEMFPHTRNSNHDSRKRQTISKVHKNGDGQSKVA